MVMVTVDLILNLVGSHSYQLNCLTLLLFTVATSHTCPSTKGSGSEAFTFTPSSFNILVFYLFYFYIFKSFNLSFFFSIFKFMIFHLCLYINIIFES